MEEDLMFPVYLKNYCHLIKHCFRAKVYSRLSLPLLVCFFFLLIFVLSNLYLLTYLFLSKVLLHYFTAEEFFDRPNIFSKHQWTISCLIWVKMTKRWMQANLTWNLVMLKIIILPYFPLDPYTFSQYLLMSELLLSYRVFLCHFLNFQHSKNTYR